MDITASRLRVLGHPARLRIMRAVEHEPATVEQLARTLGLNPAAAGVHARMLYRTGILSRVDRSGPPAYRLSDWPSLWLVDQFARRLREQTAEFAPSTDVDEAGEGSTCR
ncbi:hypothetical protein DSM112329_00786 [Paraconexibacter sp. AEG42_29]|uniref:HTH arsR-type domain-containing protein n=1 Tax=Paraconexibacter sp. AEG42_29 TaxID=2997339 RepID=A0AAU7AQJ7_9ACTN